MRKFFTWRHAVLESELPATTKHVLLTLSCYMNDVGESCFPSIETLVKNTSLSRVAIMKHIKIAKDQGWINVDQHGFRGQGWKRNEYKINFPDAVNDVDHVEETRSISDQEGGQPESEKAVNDVDLITPEISSSISSTFDQFWSVYPKKVQKKTSLDIWKRKKLHNKAEQIIENVKNRVDDDLQWSRGYIPNPTTYLNQERWEDEHKRKGEKDENDNGTHKGRFSRATDAVAASRS